ncbi:MAG: sugar ABC transporter substrate-binding protein [SAR324 cluster bacterium]|jgi:ABC-type glycerol-3-phosphate transport system substrate-binding protein|nr:sugar ABC transporter substrate-binding protein [SAR324 cluster bacterium]
MLKRFVTIVAASLLGASVAGAGDNVLPYKLKSGKPYAGTTLNILSVVTPQFKAYELRDEEFESLTGITVNWAHIPFVSLQEKVSSVGVAADGSFDVVNYLDSWGPPNAYWFVALDDRLKADGISMSRYPQAFAKSAMYKGKVMGFPLRAHPQLMFYRKDLFAKHGLSVPKSWDDVARAGKVIKQKEGIGGLACYYGADGNRQNLFIWLNYLWAAGADVFDTQMKPAWATPAGLKATRDYVALHTQHNICGGGAVSNVEQDARIQFSQGKAAMIPVWWWAYSGFSNPNQSKLDKSKVAFTGMPSYQGKTVTYAISMPFSISQHSKHQDAAWEFMKWLSNPELDRRNAIERQVKDEKIINNVATHISSLTDSEVNAANDNIQIAAAASLENSDIMPQIPEWPEIGDLLSNAIQKASTGGDVDQLMKDAAKQAERILRRAGY